MRIALIKSGHLTLVGAMEHLVEKLDRLDSAGAGSALVAVSSTAAVANGGSSAKAKEGALRTPLAPREASSAASALGGGDGRASARARARWSLLRGLGASACVEHEEVMEELRYTLRPFFQVCAPTLRARRRARELRAFRSRLCGLARRCAPLPLLIPQTLPLLSLSCLLGE